MHCTSLPLCSDKITTSSHYAVRDALMTQNFLPQGRYWQGILSQQSDPKGPAWKPKFAQFKVWPTLLCFPWLLLHYTSQQSGWKQPSLWLWQAKDLRKKMAWKLGGKQYAQMKKTFHLFHLWPFQWDTSVSTFLHGENLQGRRNFGFWPIEDLIYYS